MDFTATIIRDITGHIGHVMKVRNIPYRQDGNLEQLIADYSGAYRTWSMERIGKPETPAEENGFLQKRLEAYLDYLQEHEVGSYCRFQPLSEQSVEGELLFDRDGEMLQIPLCLEDFT